MVFFFLAESDIKASEQIVHSYGLDPIKASKAERAEHLLPTYRIVRTCPACQ